MEKLNNVFFCMLASEEALSKNWLSKEDEEAWEYLSFKKLKRGLSNGRKN